jgi:hypothetical protein
MKGLKIADFRLQIVMVFNLSKYTKRLGARANLQSEICSLK